MKIYGKEIPGLEIGIFALVVLSLAYFLGSRTGKAAAVSVGDKDIKAGSLSYDLSQYKVLADRILEAVEGYGSDEEAIYTVFRKMRTTSDVLQLSKSFGSRGAWYSGKSSLAAWLAGDLNNAEIAEVNKILASNFIAFQF